MIFEYDENKSLINKEKHGIDFKEAQKLWENSQAQIAYERSVDGEDRFSIVGYIDEKCFIAIFTLRGAHIRIISVRRCRTKEKRRFQDENNS
ncbi:MAG TPA: BrnT family toxin [Campylobacterales bacterium]|nr:BrnT family toxin [Campylobacterales bacterium]